MIALSERARSQPAALTDYYAERDRDKAIDNLGDALEAASARILAGRGPFFDTPRAYPAVRRDRVTWLKQRSYWIASETSRREPVIVAIFHESADIPRRF